MIEGGPYRVECWLERGLRTRAGVGAGAPSFRRALALAARLRREWSNLWSECRIVRVRDERELARWECPAPKEAP